MSDSLADKLQIWGFEENFIIFSDGSLGFALQARGLDITAHRNEDIGGLSEKLSTFLNGIPEETDIQFVFSITDNNDQVFNEFSSFVDSSQNQISKKLATERLMHLKAESQNGVLPKYELIILVRRDFGKTFLKKKKFFQSNSNFKKVSDSQFEEAIRNIKSLEIEIKLSLADIGIITEPINDQSVFREIYQQWNPTREVPTDKTSLYDPTSVREHLVFTDALIYENGFALGETHHRVISLKLLPQQVISGMAREFWSLPIGSKLFISIKALKQQREIETLQAQRKTAYAMSQGKTGVSDIESDAKLVDIENILEELISQKEHLFEMSLQVILAHQDPLALNEMVRDTLFTLRGLNGAEGMVESLASFDIFSELSIPNARAKERARKMKSSYTAEFLPVIQPWAGHSLPRALLKTDSGTLLKFDPMDSSLGNFNQIVSGGSGSGKSFCANLLLLQMTKFSPRIFILDIGGSYRKICDALGGQYINFSLGSGQALNPFDLSLNVIAPDSTKLKFLLALIEIMIKEDDFEHLGKLQRAEVEEAIKLVYSKPVEEWKLSSLQEILLANPDDTIKRLGRVMAPWVGATPYGEFLDMPTTIKLDSPIVCFDLKGLENFPDLQAVCLYTITDFIWREVQKEPARMKFVVLDECWKLLESDSGSLFIGELFRTFRKYFASAIAISQNIDDFAKSKVATAILSNSSIKWILSQKGADQARLAETLQLNPNERALVESITHNTGTYSEAFLMAGDNRALVSIEPTPLEYWLATSDSRDLAKLSLEQTKNSKPLFETLEALSKAFPKGMAKATTPKRNEAV